MAPSDPFLCLPGPAQARFPSKSAAAKNDKTKAGNNYNMQHMQNKVQNKYTAANNYNRALEKVYTQFVKYRAHMQTAFMETQ